MTRMEIIQKLNDEFNCGYFNANKVLKVVGDDYNEARELLEFSCQSSFARDYEIIKLIKRVKILEDRSE